MAADLEGNCLRTACHRLPPGDVASIIANAVPEWVFADMGILCAGGVSSGIYPTDSAVQVEYLVNDSRTQVIFAEDEEQLDKILSCRARCPTLQTIVVFDMEGLSGFTDPMVMSLAEFMAMGRNHMVGRETLWDEMIASRGADDLAILVYTSGTTGPPKGAMHSNRGVTHQMRHANDLFPSNDARSGWCSCRSAMSPSGSAAITPRWRWDR